MELRVLEYFLAVTREESISAAAEALHLSQPTLSRQLKDMEDELGKQLFIRSNRKITLTEEGMILRKRAQEILSLVQKAELEISLSNEVTAGDIYIGAGETDSIRHIAKIVNSMRALYPLIHLHIISGDKTSVCDDLDKGLIDFGLFFGNIDSRKYESIKLPFVETYGVIMKKNDPMAKFHAIEPNFLWNKPLIVSRQTLQDKTIKILLNCNEENLNIVGTYNLLFNGSLMVDEGMGYAIGFDKIINSSSESNLCFRPFTKQVTFSLYLAWKKYQLHTKATSKFLEYMKEAFDV